MATDTIVSEFNAQPIENTNGTLAGLRLTRSERTVRKASDGRVLDYGGRGVDVETITIPIDQLEAVVAELVSWPVYFATGEAARDTAAPVSLPNSTATAGK